MILVQNLRQLLSGNKTLKYIFSGIVLFTSLSVIKAMPVPKPDSTYKVAIILPFHLNKYYGNNVNRANIMLDYYQGFYLGLREYEDQGLNLKLYFYDNEHDTDKTKEILANPLMKEMDLIVSPILNEHLHIINHFSSKNQVPVFSPFTAIDSLFPNNPLFFNAAPANKTKAEVFYEYYRKTGPDKQLLVIKNEADWENGFGPELVKLLKTKDKINYRILTAAEITKADSHFLPKKKEYLIYHYSENSKGVKTLTNFLDKQKADFEVVTDYKPFRLKAIPHQKRIKYDFKIISSDFINPVDSAVILKDFKNDYKLLFNFNPSRYSLIGHDQAAFISDIFLKYGRFSANDFIGDIHDYYDTKFLFKKDRHCNQNKGMYILRISDDDLLEEIKY